MKKKLLLVAILASAFGSFSQIPQYLWSLGLGSAGADNGNAVATDSQGNIYLAGDFNGSATFGTTVLVSVNVDGFLAKFDPAGNCLWAVKCGGTGGDFCYGVAVDYLDQVFITGEFNGTATLGTTSLVSAGFTDTFVAKLDSNGNWLWAIRAGGTVGDQARAIACDGLGNAYITGHFNSSPASFGSNNISANGTDMFIAKVNDSGTWQWAVKAGGANNDYGKGIAITSNNEVIITGYFYQSMLYGSTTLTSAGWDDVFVGKLNANGAWQWGVRGGGAGTDESHSVATDASNNIYICGNFAGTASFGINPVTSQSGTNDVFCAKLNTSGMWQWVLAGGGTQHDFGRGITVGSNNHIYVTGWVQGTSYFGTSSHNTFGFADAFIAKINSGTNNWEWLTAGGSINNDNGLAIASSAMDVVYATGACSQSATFGSYSLPGNGFADAFLNKVSDNLCAGTNILLQTSYQNISCYGANDGMIEVIPSGGTGTYTYSWAGVNPQPNSGTAASLPPGQYLVMVTDGNNCAVSSQVFTITEPPPLVSNLISFVDWVCYGDNDGEASYDTQGGTPPYSWSWNTNPPTTSSDIQGLSAGTYILTTTDDNNCSVTNTLVIQSYPQILVTVTENGGVLSATSGYASYQWYVYNNQVTGAIFSDYTPVSSGMYHVEVSDGNGCKAASASIAFVYIGVDIIEAENLRVYPNPFQNYIVLDFPKTNFNYGREYILTDLSGRIISRQQANTEVLVIDASGFAKGMYMLQYPAGNGTDFIIPLVKY